MTRQEKRHYKERKKVLQKKIWDLEFLKYQLKSMREGFRMEFDRLREMLDASKRRLAGEKFQFYYSASRDEVSYKAVPLMPDDLLKLPDEPKDTKEFRFYKKPREKVNETVCKNLETMIQRYSDDTEKLAKQIEGIDDQIDGPSNSVNERMDSMRTAITLLDEYLTRKQYD